MPLLVMSVVLVIGVVLIVRGFLNTEPRVLVQILRWAALALIAGVSVLLIIAGREGLLLSAAAVTAPLVMRGGWRRWLGWGRAGEAKPGQCSQVETRFLRMTLDHASGALSGQVIAGRFTGRSLDSLGLDEALALRDECRRGDPASLPVLEAWLDRCQGADWRDRDHAGASGASGPVGDGPMTPEEARAILGLEAGAAPAAIREAHRRLMTRLHPDHGGSTWIAAKLNQARDVLLRS